MMDSIARHLVLLLVAAFVTAASASPFEYDQDPINYSTAPVSDPVAGLQRRIERGEVKLAYDEETGYLKALLEELKVPVSSQVLVFSKTSFQRNRISPKTPRALYFNDDVYVGYCMDGDVIEISSTDPTQGAIFYTVAQRAEAGAKFLRQTHACLQCHDSSSMTGGVPGHVVRSVFTDKSGQPLLSAGTFRTTQESPLKERWGGWYVTGTHGKQVHLGNGFLEDEEQPEKFDFAGGANVTSLAGRFDASGYLTSHSDIVALMVLEHQTQMHNLITKASYLARVAMRDLAEMNKALGEPADRISDSTRSRIKSAAEPLVKYMLFAGEAKLTERLAGTSGFAEEFAAKGPTDEKGRSLREFDLTTRMFKYPCSYLIYSESFDRLPENLKDQVYGRLYEVLSGKDTSKEFAHLTGEDREAILEILLATKKDLPESWKQSR
jgi:hypothetical protein